MGTLGARAVGRSGCTRNDQRRGACLLSRGSAQRRRWAAPLRALLQQTPPPLPLEIQSCSSHAPHSTHQTPARARARPHTHVVRITYRQHSQIHMTSHTRAWPLLASNSLSIRPHPLFFNPFPPSLPVFLALAPTRGITHHTCVLHPICLAS